MRKFHRFIRLPDEDRAALVHAFRRLVVWRLRLWLLPVRVLRERARVSARNVRTPYSGTGLHACSAGPRASSTLSVERVAWAVEVAARYVPGATCLTQALAAQSLLSRGGHRSELHIGVAKGPGNEFGAHAWVQCEDRIVIGGANLDRYTPLLAWEEGS
jgi:hypothetical protein